MDSKKMEHTSQIERQVQIGSLRQMELLNKESTLQLMNDENYKYSYSFPNALASFLDKTAWGFGYILSGIKLSVEVKEAKSTQSFKYLSQFLLLKITPF